MPANDQTKSPIPATKDNAPAAQPPAPPAAADAPPPAPAGTLKVGSTAMLTAVYGRLVHPYQVPLEFNQGVITKVDVDDWVVTQFEAGKLRLAD